MDTVINFPKNTVTCWKSLDDFNYVFKNGHTKMAGKYTYPQITLTPKLFPMQGDRESRVEGGWVRGFCLTSLVVWVK